MNIRSLETLLWITRLGSFSAAARHLRLTQPAITRRINELEADLGAPLFNRERPQITLTAAGKKCLQIAERIVADISALRAAVDDNAGLIGVIRLGVAEVIALSWLDRLLVRIAERYPNIEVDLDIDLSARLVNKLNSRNIDMALLPGPVALPGAVTESLGSYGLSWMAHPALVKIDRDITPADFADVPILTAPKDANVFSIMQKWFVDAGVKPRRVSYCASFSVIASLVRKGIGASLLPHDFFRDHVEEGAMVIVPASPRIGPAEYYVSYLPTGEMSFLPEIASFAKEESWFFKADENRSGWSA
ncbi:LysR family transcriptional regulator [Labrys monachus]|uniref:DNA-binding transcriptional LysR family regulator n=1 Tax=Labrys monachus TaxID=217067 RepID=A0ABU0FB89_9HYPH|nr:LysR family transcriptional regulator [Labrys monachus]MDQ0391338.1 DNA-binding transcriptional LysR family regulator [Labrys monachus]